MNKIRNVIGGLLSCIVIFYTISCQDTVDQELQLEKNGGTIMMYLRSNPSYSILVEAMDKVDLSKNLDLYGTMTIFAPSNDAFQKFFARKGISDISQIDNDELKQVLLYHLFNRIFGSGYFVSGSLPSPTIDGPYIQMDISNGIKNTVLNGTINVDSLDISASNGIIHVIDDVLEPPMKTLYEWLKEQPEYSIMVEAFEKTGNDTTILNKVVYDPLNISFGKPVVKWKTVFLETDEVLNENGIQSFDDLVARYSNTGNYELRNDSLNIFVRYHCVEKKLFVSDFTSNYLETFSHGSFLIFDVSSELTINKKSPDDYVGFDIEKSNRVANNGIFHSINSVLEIYFPPAVELNLLFAGDPEDRNIQLTTGEVVNFASLETFDRLNNDTENQDRVWWLNWGGDMTGKVTAEWPSTAFSDYGLVIEKNDGEYWLELTTKPIFKGTYKVFVTYRRTNNTNYLAQFYWDDEEFGDLTDLLNNKDVFGTNIGGTDKKLIRGLGILTFDEMKSHKFKLYLPNPGTNYTAWYSLLLQPI